MAHFVQGRNYPCAAKENKNKNKKIYALPFEGFAGRKTTIITYNSRILYIYHCNFAGVWRCYVSFGGSCDHL